MKKIFVIICLTLSLASCGFKLRSSNDLAPQLHTLYLQSHNPYGQLELALKNSLHSLGINLVKNNKAAPVTLNIIRTSFSNSNPTVSSSSAASVYTLNYSVIFNLLNNKQQAIIPLQTVSASRQLTLSPNTVLEASGEVNIIKQEMTRELILKILSRLNAKNTKKALIKVQK